MRHVARFLFAAAAIANIAQDAPAQVPAGGEFRVNATTADRQWEPYAGAAANGDFVVTWTGLVTAPAQYDVFAQRYRADGAPLGGEFRVNTYTTGVQRRGHVAVHEDGSFMIVWLTTQGQQGFWAQRYDRAGAAVGTEFRVDATGAGGPSLSVGVDRRGDFVVSWWTTPAAEPSGGVFAQRVSAQGVLLGAEFQVNSFTPDSQILPTVAVRPGGDFVIAWQSHRQDGSEYSVFAQSYAADGSRIGGEFMVHAATTGTQRWPEAASDGQGNVVIAWTDEGRDGSGGGVFAQRFSPAGARIGGEFQVNTFTAGHQSVSSVRAGQTGSFVVTWNSAGQDGSGSGVFAQRFRSDGARLGGEFQVNTYTSASQALPAIAHDAVGNFTVAWTSLSQDGSGYGIYAQRFGGLHPAALAVDTAGNRVLEPGEAVDVRPSWANQNGATQAFSGALASVGGPAGTTVVGTDTAAVYGTVPPNVTAICTDCYGVSVAPIPARPAAHLDAGMVERIVPDAQGQEKFWLLHIGASYADVPATSPYYRFVETLLHHWITVGCTTTTYCPADSTTREQMAVFVLVAREGSDYVPPACGTPMFPDVPASSPFCRWVEELARRGVAGGCGGGNYCPAASVTRDQMAVFVLRTLEPALIPASCVPPNLFADVPETSPFCRWVEELANRGNVSGCGGGNYCPTSPVTREQMAVFIAATFGLTLYGV